MRRHWRDWDKPSGRSNRASGAWCKEEGATVVETNIHTATDSCLLVSVKRGTSHPPSSLHELVCLQKVQAI